MSALALAQSPSRSGVFSRVSDRLSIHRHRLGVLVKGLSNASPDSAFSRRYSDRPTDNTSNQCSISAAPSSNRYRSHLCGELRREHAGLSVKLCGWVQNVRRLGSTIVFITLRDAYGLVQLTFSSEPGQQDPSSAASVVASPELVTLAGSLRLETVITVSGVVASRPASLVNPAMPTGEVEVIASSLDVLGPVTENLPFTIGPSTSALGSVPEDTRLAHRPVDLRRDAMQRNLRVRSAVTHAVRRLLHEASHPPFVEVETPSLFRSTPEGAREFLVPSRQTPPGRAYALTQSPQQHKQMLMVAGVDRYFQIARCYRDEAGRADRQPEFTQIDLEMACAEAGDVMGVTEGVLATAFAATAALGGGRGSASPILGHVGKHSHVAAVAPALPAWAPLRTPLPRVTYTHALCVYGSDKPDRRHGIRIGDITGVLLRQGLDSANEASGHPLAATISAARASELLQPSESAWFPSESDSDLSPLLPSAVGVKAFVAPGLGSSLSRKEWDAVGAEVDRAVGGPQSSVHVYRVKVEPDGTWKGSPVIKVVPAHVQQAITAASGAVAGDMVVLGTGSALPLCKALGTVRLALAEARRRKGLPVPADAVVPDAPGGTVSADVFWVTDFPLFELPEEDNENEEQGVSGSGAASAGPARLQSVHHPFTAPRDDDAPLLLELMASSPGEAAASAGGAPPSFDPAVLPRLLCLRGQHYDLVCNGVELGGGSIRVHSPSLQRFILAHVLRVTPAQLEGFRPLLSALASGAPPHGGLALGLDRLVATLVGPGCAASVRDVIAFPKSAAGNDLLTGAPALATAEQWEEVHLRPTDAPDPPQAATATGLR